MTRYDDEDFEETVVPGTEDYTSQDFRNYLEEDPKDDDALVNKFKSISNLANQLNTLNTDEVSKNNRKNLDILTTMFMTDRLRTGIDIEAVKKMALNRLVEVMPSLTGQELVNTVHLLSQATENDLNLMLQPNRGGIQFNIGGPQITNNDNSIHNSLTQNQQVNYANNKQVAEMEPKVLNSLGKVTEAANIFKQLQIPVQNQIEHIPDEIISTPKDVAVEFIQNNIKEDKEQEQKILNDE